ncbi:MAG: GNAT family N-acetyltransferase [Promethearchaeota archaeon]
MKPNLSDLFRLTEDHIKPAGKMLARAFEDNPIFIYLIPDTIERKNKLRYIFEFIIHYGVLYGEVYAPSSNLEGVAAWLPSEKAYKTIKRMILSGGENVLKKLGRDFYVKKSKPLEDWTDSIHKRLAPFRHWYLEPLGVDPKFQGKGNASILLKAMLVRVDQEQLPIFLITNLEKNVQIYQHFGFKILEQATFPGTNWRNWFMLRDNQT